MKNLFGINNYSDSYTEYANKVLKESAATLEKAGIKVFPWNTYNEREQSATSSVVLYHKAQNKDAEQTGKHIVESKDNSAKWIREAMPTYKNSTSISSSIMSQCNTHLGKVSQNQSNQSNSESQPAEGDDDGNISYDAFDIKDIEDQTDAIDKLSNASDDEGDGNLLQTFFEKDINDGFSSNNFAGTMIDNNITEQSSDSKVVVYSDNLYHKKNTSIIFGGTANLSYINNISTKSENFDYNVYSYGKYKSKNFTYGLGGMGTRNDGVTNINISVGTMHNASKIYGIMQKEINIIPGLPTQTKTDINIGIGTASGLLNPDTYNPKDPSIEEISKIDASSAYVEGEEVDVPTDDDVEKAAKKGDVTVNLIIRDTNNNKEYGIKVGKVYGHMTKNNNYSFIMPFAEVSNLNVDSNEGAKFLAGAVAGQNISFNGWNVKTKGVVEASRTVVTGSRPSDHILANLDVKAGTKNFDSELSAGMYFDNTKTYCKYLDAKVNYAISKNLTTYLKAGVAQYNFDNDTKISEIAAGVHYSF